MTTITEREIPITAEFSTESISSVMEIPLTTETVLEFTTEPHPDTSEIYVFSSTTIFTLPSLPTASEVITLFTTTEIVSGKRILFYF